MKNINNLLILNSPGDVPKEPLSKYIVTPESREKLYDLQKELSNLKVDNDNTELEVVELKEKIEEISNQKEFSERKFEQLKLKLLSTKQ